MGKLDKLVTDHLVERLLNPERLATILSSLSASRADKAAVIREKIASLQNEVSDANGKLARLYALVEQGLTDLDDVLKDRLKTLKAERERTMASLERAKNQATEYIEIDPALVDKFGSLMRENITCPAPYPSARPISNRLLAPSR